MNSLNLLLKSRKTIRKQEMIRKNVPENVFLKPVLKDLAEGTELGDVTTLADVSIVETITKEIADRR